ncbi:hypothetical protein IJT17_06095 [bacterium]|nr:hypothetical protein [bacterium]
MKAHEALPRWVDILLLSALIITVCYYNLNWAKLNNQPPASDAATHAYQSVIFHQIITNVRIDRAVFQFLAYRSHYPPLSYQLGEFGYMCMGLSPEAPIVGMFPFIAMLGISMYLLGCHMGGRLGGLYAAIATCTSPIVLEYSRMTFIDFQLCATVALGLCAIIYCDAFSKLKPSIFCGIAIALGMLTKWTFPLFVAFPLLAAIIGALRSGTKDTIGNSLKLLALSVPLALGQYFTFSFDHLAPPENVQGWLFLSIWLALLASLYAIAKKWLKLEIRTPLDNMAISILTALTIMGPWYGRNIDRVWYKAVYQAGVEVQYQQVLTKNLLAQNTWVYGALIMITIGLIVGLWRRQTRWLSVQLVLTWALTMAILAYAPFDPRYIIPLMVHTVCISSCGFALYQILGIVPIVLFAAVGVLQASYHTLTSPPQWYTMRQVIESPVPVPLPLPCYPQLPIHGEYPFKELISELNTYTNSDGGRWCCLFLGAVAEDQHPDRPIQTTIQPRAFLYYAALNGWGFSHCAVPHIFDIFSPLAEEHMHDVNPDLLKNANYALMYRDTDLAYYANGYDCDAPSSNIREELIKAMQQKVPSFPKKIATKKLYYFGPNIVIELLKDDK